MIEGKPDPKHVSTSYAERMSPALAAGVSDRLWSVEDIANLIEAAAAKPGKRGPYKRNTTV